jgi:hypothetical protein
VHPKAIDNVGGGRCKLVDRELGASKVIHLVPPHVGAFELRPLRLMPGHVAYEGRHL